MDQMAFVAVLGVLVIALPAIFFLGRRAGVSQGQRAELARQTAAKASAIEGARKVLSFIGGPSMAY